jgi:N-acetylglucosamine-6-phosphate deacetylase
MGFRQSFGSVPVARMTCSRGSRAAAVAALATGVFANGRWPAADDRSHRPTPVVRGSRGDYHILFLLDELMKTAYTAHRLYTPTEEVERPCILVEDGSIVDVFSRSAREVPAGSSLRDLGNCTVAPGFLDVHMHGGAGVDLMRAPAADVPRLGKFLAAHGVTSYFPTTVAAPLDATCLALDRLADAIEAAAQSGQSDGARPIGIHLEGPYLSMKRRGVHIPENLLHPTLESFGRMCQAARGYVRMMTIAPELPGAMEVIAEAARRNVCVSIGHSDADLATAQNAVTAGARHATHTFNAMRPLDHRDPGIIAEVLTDNRLSADIIVDGIHVSPPVVQIFMKTKGVERAVLITDCISATGMPDGQYQLGPILVDVKDGKCTANGSLAGSVLTMDRAVRNVTQFAQWSLKDAVRAATLNPAQAVGLAEKQGTIVAGARADFVALSDKGEVLKTVVGGREC